jgi:hypothetical protein
MFLRKISYGSTRFIAIALCGILPHAPIFSEDIATLATTALKEIQSIQSEIESRQIEESIKSSVAALTQDQRMDFVEEVARAAASVDSVDKTRALFSAFALIKMTEMTTQDKAVSLSRLFEDSDPSLNKIAEGFLKGCCLDIRPSDDSLSRLSVLRAILEERSHAANEKLISFLFQLMPIEAASWLAENIEMTDDERAILTNEIELAHRILRSAEAPLQAPTGETMTNAVREQKLREWAMGNFWILQFVSKALMEKYPAWTTPDLQIATKQIKVPATIELRIKNLDQSVGQVKPIKIPPPPVAPASVSDEDVMRENRRSASWIWLLVATALGIMTVVIVLTKKQ